MRVEGGGMCLDCGRRAFLGGGFGRSREVGFVGGMWVVGGLVLRFGGRFARISPLFGISVLYRFCSGVWVDFGF